LDVIITPVGNRFVGWIPRLEKPGKGSWSMRRGRRRSFTVEYQAQL
jgi:hypothetical protein